MNTQNLCLGALHFCEASGYEIKQMFENTFSHFQNPGFGSIYPALEKLHQSGYVTSRVEEQEKRPAKKIYKITQAGRSHFSEVLYKTSPDEVCKSDFVLLAFFAHLLDNQKFQSIMQQHEDNIKEELSKLEAIKKYETMPSGMQFTIDYGIDIKRAQLRFLKKNRERVIQQHQNDCRN